MAAPSASAAKPSAATSCGQPVRETVRGTLRAGMGSHLPLPWPFWPYGERSLRLQSWEVHETYDYLYNIWYYGRGYIYDVEEVPLSGFYHYWHGANLDVIPHSIAHPASAKEIRPRLEGFRFLIRDKSKSRISFRKEDGIFRSKEKDGKDRLVRNREEDFHEEGIDKKEAGRNAIRREGIRTEEGCQEEDRLPFCWKDGIKEILFLRQGFRVRFF